MDELIRDLDRLYTIIGNASDLFDATKMMFKNREEPAAQSIVENINSFLRDESFQFFESAEKKLSDLKIELEKINNRIKEIDANIKEEENKLNNYMALEESEEKERLIADSTAQLEKYRESKKEILKTKESLEVKIARLNELYNIMKAKFKNNKKYKIDHKVSIVLTNFLEEDDFELKGTIIASEGKEITEETYDEMFDKFANALDKNMSNDKKTKLKSALFPYVTNALGDKNFTEEDMNKLKAIIAGYKAKKVIDEELHSEESERKDIPLTPIAESREEGHKAAESKEAKESARTEGVHEIKPEEKSSSESIAEEMEPREVAPEQTIAVLMSSGVLPKLELDELEQICKQLQINISEKGLNTVLDKEQLHRLLFHKDIREMLLKDSLNKKTDEVLNEYNSMIEQYDELIKEIEENQISFSPEFLAKVKDIRGKLVVARDQYVSKSGKHISNVEFKGNRLNDINSKLNSKYKEYEKFKKVGNEKKMKKIYQQIDKLRGKEIKLMSKQVRVANKNCDRFIEIANRQHSQYQRRQDSVLEAANQIFEYKSQIDDRIASNNEIRDNVLLDGFDQGLTRRDIRQANRDIKRNNRAIQQLMKKQGKVDRNFQHTKISEKLEEYYSGYSR